MSTPQSTESDIEVIEVFPTDRQKPVDNIRTRTFFVVKEQLDEEILKIALDRLIRDHWRKLAARLVKRPRDGVLEWHLPKTFDEKYVLFRWSSKVYDHSIEKTGLPKTTPPEHGVVLLPSTDVFDGWFRPSDWPFEQNDEPNAPPLHVHISMFSDNATVIAISWPHVMGDQHGVANIMKAWLGLARGDIPPFMLGFDEDLTPNSKEYSEYNEEEIVRKGRMRVRRTGEFPLILLGLVPDLVFRQRETKYSVLFPVPVVESLRERCTQALKEKYGKDPGLTNGDVLTGVLTKFSQMHRTSKGKISMSQSINLRGRVPKLEGDAANAFVHNSVHNSTAYFDIEPSTPVAEIAYQNRLALNHALDPRDIEIGMAVIREMSRRGQLILTCEPFGRSHNFSNWTSAWRDLDFSPAVKSREKTGDGSTKPSFLVLGEGRLSRLGLSRFATTIMCKTEDNYWCNFAMPVKGMNMVEEYLKQDPMLELL